MLKWLPHHHIKFVKKSIHQDQIVIYKKSNSTQSTLLVWGLSHPVWANGPCARNFIEEGRSRLCPCSLWADFGNQNILPAAPSPSVWELFLSLCCASWGTSDIAPCSNTLIPTILPLPSRERVHRKSLHDSVPPKCKIRPIDNKSPLSPSPPNDILLI